MRTKEPAREADGSLRADFVTEFPLTDLDPDVRRTVQLLDLGCGTGESLANAERRFGCKGIGIDNSPHKVRRSRRRGFDVWCADVLELDPDDFPGARYVNLDNVLEHMPDLDMVEAMVAQACRLAGACVHIRHPSFEEVGHLADLGVKLFWTDWPSAHSAPVRIHEFVEMAERIGVYQLVVQPVQRIVDAADPCVLPLSAPPDQQRFRKKDAVEAGGGGRDVYDPGAHGPKPNVSFERPVYFAFDIVLVTSGPTPTLEYPGDPLRNVTRPTFRWPVDGPAADGRRRGRRSG